MKLEFSEWIFNKYSNIKCYANQSNGSWVVLCGQMVRQTDRQMDLMKLIVASHKFVNAPEEWTQLDMEYPNLGCARFELCSHDWGFCGFVQSLHVSSGIVPVPSSSPPHPPHIVTAATASATTATTITTTTTTTTTTFTWYSILAVAATQWNNHRKKNKHQSH